MIVHNFYQKKLNLSLIFFPENPDRRGGLSRFVLEIRQEGGSYAQEIQVREGGLKNDPIRQGGEFFLE